MLKIISKDFELAESPVWDKSNKTLYWVDILNKTLYSLQNNQIKNMVFDEYISYVSLTNTNDLLIALESGIYLLEFPKIKTLKKLASFNDDNFRCNDGAVDFAGRLLIGRMNNGYNYGKIPCSHDGKLYILNDKKLTVLIDNVSISNGIEWSFDNTTMYYVDSLDQTIVSYDYNLKIGSISNKQVLYKSNHGTPDGMCMDNNGNLWVAIYGGSKVICFNPKTKQIIEQINLERKNISSCCFGEDSTLFITTAKDKQNTGCVYEYKLNNITGAKVNSFLVS